MENTAVNIGEQIKFHDPLIITDEGQYYCFSTDTNVLGVQRSVSKDLIHWDLIRPVFTEAQVPADVRRHVGAIPAGPKVPPEKMGKHSFWAPELVKHRDEWRLYFCCSTFGSTQSMIGLAAGKSPGGDFEYRGNVIKTYQTENAYSTPNAIDPNVVQDRDGVSWLVYGSFFAGIHIIRLSEEGFPAEPGYGKRIAGGDHTAIEGAYIIYDDERDRYCLFVSYGSLSYDYRICAAYSKQIDGPYIDSQGLEMTNLDPVFSPGDKIVGGYNFDLPGCRGFMGPGHNSLLRLADGWYVVHHVRAEGIRENPFMQIRKLFFTKAGRICLSPAPYSGGRIETLTAPHTGPVSGMMSFIRFDRWNNGVVYGRHLSIDSLKNDGLEKRGEDGWVVKLFGKEYSGFLFTQDEILYLSAVSADGEALWGRGGTAVPPVEQFPNLLHNTV